MKTAIGQNFGPSRARTYVALSIALVAIAVDFGLVLTYLPRYWVRLLPAFVAMSALMIAARGNRASLGLTFQMKPSYYYWVKVAFICAVVVTALCISASIGTRMMAGSVANQTHQSGRVVLAVIRSCVLAPIVEEVLYRVVFCTALVGLIGSRWTILLTGLIFAALHFAYGKPAPDNLFAGFFLAWVFLKSGSALVPVLLHSLGNVIVLATRTVG